MCVCSFASHTNIYPNWQECILPSCAFILSSTLALVYRAPYLVVMCSALCRGVTSFCNFDILRPESSLFQSLVVGSLCLLFVFGATHHACFCCQRHSRLVCLSFVGCVTTCTAVQFIWLCWLFSSISWYVVSNCILDHVAPSFSHHLLLMLILCGCDCGVAQLLLMPRGLEVYSWLRCIEFEFSHHTFCNGPFCRLHDSLSRNLSGDHSLI